jgi:hypothetical protein
MTTAPFKNDFDGPHAAALDLLGHEINKTREKLLSLQATYEMLGGTYEDDEAQSEQNRLPAPEAPGDYCVNIGGISIDVTGKQKAVVEMLQASGGEMVKTDDIAGVYGGIKQHWYNDQTVLNKKLAKAGVIVANVRGLGYKLEKV